MQLLSMPHPHPHPLLHPLCPQPPQQQRRIMIQMKLFPHPHPHPHPVLEVSHPHPQFVAAKSLMFKSSKGFCLHSIICQPACHSCLFHKIFLLKAELRIWKKGVIL